MVKTTNNSNSEDQQVDTSPPVYHEELKNSFSEEVEQRKRRLDLLNALKSKNLELTKELIKQVEHLDTVYPVKRKKDDCIVAMRPLLYFFVKNAFEDDSWFKFYQDVLLEQDGKIDINAGISSDDTALSYACREGKVDVARFLFDHGANPNVGEPDAMQIATDKGNTELINLFNQKLRTWPKRLNDMYELFGTQEKVKTLNEVGTKKKVDRLNRVNPDLLHILLEKRIIHGGNGVDKLFGIQEKVDRLNRVNLDLFQTLLKKRIIRNTYNMDRLLSTQEKVDRLNNIELDLLQILINRGFIRDSNGLSRLLNDEDFITNAKSNPSLTKTLLNMDSVASIMIDLIRHPKYTESSGHLLRNYKSALALLSKRAIENITIDYLFDSARIKNDLQDNEFLKNIELIDASDNVTSSMGEVIDGVFIQSQGNVENNPMPKLKDLSLEAFVKCYATIS